MDKFDEKVIGYDSIKETLRQIADVLKRPEAYKEKGVSMPRGLLMESAPGLGKSLMASILMEESGRKSFVFRRINEGNTFLGEMKDMSARPDRIKVWIFWLLRAHLVLEVPKFVFRLSPRTRQWIGLFWISWAG